MKNLVIVESPSKSKTIQKYLGSNYEVTSSMGHIRELADKGKFGLGVDIDNNFEPTYSVIKGKGKVVNDLKSKVKNADHVILASDPDREGEAISWHLKEVLKLKEDDYDRVVFHEITENAIKDAFNDKRKIDMDLFYGQQSRSILDKIVGYLLSKQVRFKTHGQRTGRVQGVALKLIVDRERVIQAFVPEEYFTIESDFKDFKAELKKYKGEKIEIKSRVEAEDIVSKLSNAYQISNPTSEEKTDKSELPFTTSTMTQTASTKLNFTSKKTMMVAQQLYEGIETDEGRLGLITYMRTDSIRLSDVFVNDAKKYILNNYGKEYVGYVKTSKKKDNVQDAHEAIRPTYINKTPDSVKKYLTPDQYKLYSLIYARTVASLMADAKKLVTSVDLLNNDYLFRANGQIYTFDGYLKVYKDYKDIKENILPDFKNYKSGVIVVSKVDINSHFTEPEPRFTEASLIKELESYGIGRPSTYASIIEAIKKEVVTFKEKKFFPTEIGFEVNDFLQKYYSDYINVKYTADMENDLDVIADGKLEWVSMLNKFWDSFYPHYNDVAKVAEKTPDKETGEVCPNCGKPLVIKKGKFGEFTACSGYPECKYIKHEEKKVNEICSCPKCDGMIIEKKTKKGKTFYGCNNYPKCNYALWDKPTGEVCPNCNELLVEKDGESICIKCNNQ